MATSARTIVLALVLAVCALGFAGVASSATPRKADKHDRGLIKKLLATPLQDPYEETDEELLALGRACAAGQNADPTSLLEHMEIPAVFRMVDRGEPELLAYQRVLQATRPHAPVFKQWIAMKRAENLELLNFVRGLDASRFDICTYLEAAYAAGTDEAAQDAAFLKLFPNEADIVALLGFVDSFSKAEASRKTLNTRFATFLRASRYTKAQISMLTGG